MSLFINFPNQLFASFPFLPSPSYPFLPFPLLPGLIGKSFELSEPRFKWKWPKLLVDCGKTFGLEYRT